MRHAALASALAIFAFASPAGAQKDFPSHPVTLTVGFAPGGGADIAARIVARKLADNIGQPVVVENRPGAAGSMAARHIAAAPANGYTISLSTVGALVISPAVYDDHTFDARRDIAPITMGMSLSGVMVVNASLPVKTLGDFVTLAKAKPGEISYATPGIGGLSHLRMELFQKGAGIKLIHVPYKGGGPAMSDLLAGRVAIYSGTPATVLPYIKAGKLRALAVEGAVRIPNMPDVPTAAEAGYPGSEAVNWYAFVAPVRTATEILAFWNREITKVLRDPDVKAQLAQHDLESQPSTREELALSMQRDTEKWTKVVHEAHITAE